MYAWLNDYITKNNLLSSNVIFPVTIPHPWSSQTFTKTSSKTSIKTFILCSFIRSKKCLRFSESLHTVEKTWQHYGVRGNTQQYFQGRNTWIEITIFGWRVFLKWHGVLERHRRFGKLGGHHYTQEWDGNQCKRYRGISLLNIPWKSYTVPSALKEDPPKQLNLNWRISCALWPTIALSFTLQQMRNLGNVQTMSTLVHSPDFVSFVNLEEHTKASRKKHWYECCGSGILTPTCYCLWKYCTPARKFVSVSDTTTVHCVCWTSTRVSTVTVFLLILYELDRQSYPSRSRIVGSCWINRLLFTYDLVLPAFSE